MSITGTVSAGATLKDGDTITLTDTAPTPNTYTLTVQGDVNVAAGATADLLAHFTTGQFPTAKGTTLTLSVTGPTSLVTTPPLKVTQGGKQWTIIGEVSGPGGDLGKIGCFDLVGVLVGATNEPAPVGG